MTARAQESPFRETAWDQRLDKMLDDLKTTVNPDDGRPSSRVDNSLVSSFRHQLQDRPDQTFLDIFRSSSRNESRNSNRSGGVEDLGLMKHHHKEYTSPDKTTKVVSDQFEYESGDPSKQYHKKVMKSTYSNYKVSGDISSNLDSLRQGPDQSIMDASRATSEHTDNTKVVSASQKVANKLVDALSTIGPEETLVAAGESSSSTMNSDYSTLTRLNKNIKELDTLLEGMDKEEEEKRSKVTALKMETRTVVRSGQTKNEAVTEKESTSKTRDVRKDTRESGARTSVNTKTTTDGPSNSYSSSYSKTNKYSSGMTNGKPNYNDDEEVEILNEPSGEVRKIVWRNRFEKTYEAQDGTPTISIEEESRRKREKQFQKISTSAISSYQPPPPPQISPGGQSWVDPIPMPTPPQISPKGEPGVAYVYTYGQSGSQVQHLPPLNYVTLPSSEGAPSPTPSSGNQPIIYHYSYHYTLQPGQSLPGGVPQPTGTSYPIQPALQVAPTTSFSTTERVSDKTGPPTMNSYEYKKTSSHTTSSNVDRSDVSNIHHHHHHHRSPERTVILPSESQYPRSPRDGSTDDRYPKGPDSNSSRNISISINKTSSSVTHTKDYPHGGPSTSTPFPTLGRSRSSSPDRYPRGPGTGPYGTVTHVTRTSYSDSLDRLRKPPHEGLPFPDTSPIKARDDSKIPRRVDDLMTSLSDSEDGPNRRPIDVRISNGPRATSIEREPFISTKANSENAELSLSERKAELKKDESRNIAGPPVYYPPGHHQLFDESMHTMTLKENKRRGMAKWRMEKASGYKESGSSSESKGGMAMVPVCLPLCCGAACAIM